MLFHSFEFFLFFPSVVILYFLLPSKYRWVLLLLASYYFYMSWNPAYALLIFFSTLVDYILARKIGTSNTLSKKKIFLFGSLGINLGLLSLFKYATFFNETIITILSTAGIPYTISTPEFLLPVGISFYTFQTLSYTIDVYRGKKQPETHFGIFALYVSFFPQLVAGPIERSTRLLPQLHSQKKLDWKRIISGGQLVLWGLFKKVVIADRVAVLVNTIYGQPQDFTGYPLILATIFFAFQIFCDFSGYSDIAIGTARILGFNLMNNFERPYFSKSISEFWRRWHISLSTWFKDYVYIPLGGNRTGKEKWVRNIFITFLISGLWHGANWTFVVWGALHGILMVLSAATKGIRQSIATYIGLTKFPKIHQAFQMILTMSIVWYLWIFFRAESLRDAYYFGTHVFVDIFSLEDLQLFMNQLFTYGLDKFEFLIAVLSIVLLEVVHIIERKQSFWKYLSHKPVILRWMTYILLTFITIFFAYTTESKDFIYFQF